MVSLPARALAMARHTGAMAGKSAVMPPLTIMLSSNWVSTRPRRPRAVASFTALVWVMEWFTAHRNTSEAFMAAATLAGGSWPLTCRGVMTMMVASAPAA